MVERPEEKKVKWPGAAYSAGANDLAQPIENMLQMVLNVGNPAEKQADDDGKNGKVTVARGTPYSLQVISSGAGSFSKFWSGIVAAGGGLAAIGTTVGGVWNQANPAVQAVAVGSVGVILAAAFVSVATIVRSDVMARGVASAARKGAVADIVTAMLNNFQHAQALVPPMFDNLYVVKRKEPNAQWERVVAFQLDGGSVKVKTSDRIVAMDDIADILDLRNVTPPAKSNGVVG
jgi:hypothetical protein